MSTEDIVTDTIQKDNNKETDIVDEKEIDQDEVINGDEKKVLSKSQIKKKRKFEQMQEHWKEKKKLKKEKKRMKSAEKKEMTQEDGIFDNIHEKLRNRRSFCGGKSSFERVTSSAASTVARRYEDESSRGYRSWLSGVDATEWAQQSHAASDVQLWIYQACGQASPSCFDQRQGGD